MDNLKAVARQLRRHAIRRRNGMPTVSVFVSASARNAQFEALLAGESEELVVARGSTLPELAQAWLNALSASHDLVSLALATATMESPDAAPKLSAAWRARSPAERALWLEHVAEATRHPAVRAAASWLSARVDGEMAPGASDDSVAGLSALVGWLPASEWPVLYLTAYDLAGLEAASELALTIPSLPVATVVSHDVWGQALSRLDARSRALLLEGRIELPKAVPAPEAGGAADPGSDAAFDTEPPSLRTLREEARAAQVLAQRAQKASADDAGDASERARSLAELLLYELLQHDPITRNLFQLNGLMPFEFGHRPAEVDLVCVARKLAVEVDGYHHFTEAASYRRDRRKDVLLQTEGFWVFRTLASDVVERSDEVVGAIKKLVQKRKRPVSARGRNP